MTWTNADLLSFGLFGTNIGDIGTKLPLRDLYSMNCILFSHLNKQAHTFLQTYMQKFADNNNKMSAFQYSCVSTNQIAAFASEL